MKTWMCLSMAVLAMLVGCQKASIADRSLLSWRVSDSGPECRAEISTAQKHNGKGSLELVTRSLPGDDAGMKAIIKVNIQRLDGEALCTLGELTQDRSQLLLDMMRDARSGKGLPPYSMPYVSLLMYTADQHRVELVWETAYNGYRPADGVYPVGTWVRDTAIDEGTFWMRTDRNFNVSDGFQPLSAWVDGHVTTFHEASTAPLDADTKLMAIEIGFGNGVPGYMHAYVDNLRLNVPSKKYVLNFEPQEKVKP
jgi:hypothetical protein